MGSSSQTVTATPRILESLIRLSEALAKLELREMVTKEDVDEAVRMLKAATYAAAIDPETGLIDMEQLIVGVGAGRRKRAKELESMMQEFFEEKGGRDAVVNLDQLRSAINAKLSEKKEQLCGDVEFNTALRSLEQEGMIVRHGKQVEVR